MLISADFSGIEARVCAWVANEQRKLDVFFDFDQSKDPLKDPYVIAAAMVYRCTTKEVDRFRRHVGKACELAFGYMGGVNAFRRFAPSSGGPVRTQAQTNWQKDHRQVDRTKAFA
jgi:hypothetical protein